MKISYIIPTYNRPKTLKEAIQSVLSQNVIGDYEILVCSDSHVEANKNVTESFQNKNIKYLVSDRKIEKFARNEGIDKMTGDYVVFLDDDNLIYPEFIQALLPYIHDNLGLLIYKINLYSSVHPNGIIIPSNKNIIEGDIDTLNGLFNRDFCKNNLWFDKDPPDYYYFKKCEQWCTDNNKELKYINNIIAIHRYIK